MKQLNYFNDFLNEHKHIDNKLAEGLIKTSFIGLEKTLDKEFPNEVYYERDDVFIYMYDKKDKSLSCNIKLISPNFESKFKSKPEMLNLIKKLFSEQFNLEVDKIFCF